MGKYIGESVLRKEDPRMVTGEAKYLDDIKIPGMLYACLLYTSPSPRDS